MKLRLLILALCLLSCNNQSKIVLDELTPEQTVTIQGLKSLYSDEPLTITQPMVISGLVTSSDSGQNFYKTLYIQSQEHGVEVMVGLDGISAIYPLGAELTIKLEGLHIAKSYGVIQIGMPPALGSGYDVDYIGSRVRADEHIFRAQVVDEPDPIKLQIGALTEAHLGSLVQIEGLTLTPQADAVWSGDRLFTDSVGNQIRVYTSTYATFADDTIPSEAALTLTGILQRPSRDTNSGFTLKLRDRYDIQRADISSSALR